MSRESHTSTKKSSRQNVGPSQVSLLNQSLTQHQQGNRLEQEESTPSFHNEISDIMRGFGDCDRPLRDSVILVEKILQGQLRGILNDAIEVAMRRKGIPCPTQADFEFLMRKHPIRINRLRKHSKEVKLLRRLLKMQAGRQMNATTSTGSGDVDSGQDSDEEIDMEIPEKFDEEKTRRQFRADRISQMLNGVQYQEFNEARRVSFHCRHSDKMKLRFRAFLGISNELRLTNSCLTILAYLAHETIATLIDFAILTRLNSGNRITDPFSRVTSSGTSPQMLHLCPEVTQGRGLDGVKPITVQEIQEAMRRFYQINRRGMGFFRNSIDNDMRRPYLAI